MIQPSHPPEPWKRADLSEARGDFWDSFMEERGERLSVDLHRIAAELIAQQANGEDRNVLHDKLIWAGVGVVPDLVLSSVKSYADEPLGRWVHCQRLNRRPVVDEGAYDLLLSRVRTVMQTTLGAGQIRLQTAERMERTLSGAHNGTKPKRRK
jgi:hypothetical protein